MKPRFVPAPRVQAGPIQEFLAADHRRLEALLEAACQPGLPTDVELYSRFREGLLRHIGMEEKVLLKAAREELGVAVHNAEVLRHDHGDITTLLVPSPTPTTVRLLRGILEAHNRLEEGPDGVYAMCERALGARAAKVLERMQAAPQVPTLAFNDSPRPLELVEKIRRARDV